MCSFSLAGPKDLLRQAAVDRGLGSDLETLQDDVFKASTEVVFSEDSCVVSIQALGRTWTGLAVKMRMIVVVLGVGWNRNCGFPLQQFLDPIGSLVFSVLVS